jgi:threonine dehydrogenase-like Zn-dependent dehydrogenase
LQHLIQEKNAKMKAAIIREPGMLQIEDIPEINEISDYQCYVKNLFAATCTGTDQKIIQNKLPWGSSYPAVLGHETIGEVIETGRKVKNFKAGDIVLRPVYVYPGEKFNGFHSEFGGFSEYGLITDLRAMEADGCSSESQPAYAKYQMKVPIHWKNNPESAIFITMKETFSWINALGPFYGKKIGVIGCGAVGLFYMKLASIMCAAEVTAIARSSRNKELALKRGADTFIELEANEKPDDKFDVLIDAAGVIEKINDFMDWIKPNGTFAVYGVGGNMAANINAFGSGLHFAFHSPDESSIEVHNTCQKLVDKGIIEMKDFHSSVMPFEKLPEAFQMIKEKKEFKPVFRF